MNKITVDEAIWLANNNMIKTNPFSGYNSEELEFLLDHPEEIETGCENNCDTCQEEAMKFINQALKQQKPINICGIDFSININRFFNQADKFIEKMKNKQVNLNEK